MPGNVIDIQEVEEERYLAAALFGLASTAQGTGVITSGCNGDALRGKAQSCAGSSPLRQQPSRKRSMLISQTDGLCGAVHRSTVPVAPHSSSRGTAHHRWLPCGHDCMKGCPLQRRKLLL